MRPLTALLVLLTFSGCATSDAASAGATTRSERRALPSTDASVLGTMLPRPKHAFVLRATPERAPSLHEVVVELEKATGVHFVVSAEARDILRKSNSGLLSDLQVPPSEAWRVVETMLAQSELLLVPSKGTEPVTIVLTTTLQPDSGAVKGYAVSIDAEAIEECADHPAVIFSTVIDLHPMDARQLATSLRQMFPDQRTQSILVLDGSQMLITGLGPQLLTSVRMMQESATSRRRRLDEENKSAAPAGTVVPR